MVATCVLMDVVMMYMNLSNIAILEIFIAALSMILAKVRSWVY